MIEITGPWTRDRAAFDPGAIVRTVLVDGHAFTVSNTMGPGWFMHIRPAFGDEPRVHVHSAGWEKWSEVEEKAREWLATR